MAALYEFFGQILGFIYNNLTPGFYKYGITIIIFTLLVKLLLLPIAIKQQRAMADMQKVQPKINEIRAKYKNDMQKMNEETMKLYSEHKVNPMGGCLPAIIQIPIFIALYGVITQPLKYIFNFTDKQLYTINYALNGLFPPSMKSQIHMVEKAKELVSAGGHDAIAYIINKIQDLPQIISLTQDFATKYGTSINDAANLIYKSSTLSMDFLGINLASFPNEHILSPVILIPLLAGLTTYLSSKLMSKTNVSTGDATMQSTQNTMLVMMPIMTLFITYSLPAGLGFYWIISNILQMIQQYFLNKYISGEALAKK